MGEKLKQARQRAGMTQAQLAEAIGCKQKDVSRWEAGLIEPGVLTVKKMAQALGCSMDDLV
ncbi:MAG: helix-turn-helix transcriptional regulator [Akkermansia sp.]|nr:helix-turn-helix transcriptional regulator [Akkermansia sp.]